MKKLSLLLTVCMSGCLGIGTIKDPQPAGVKYYKVEPYLFQLSGFQEFSIKAPMETITKDGVTTTRPIMVKDAKGNETPVLPEIKIKDTGVQPPKTWLDFGNSILRTGLAFGLGYKALDTIGELSSSIPRDPAIVQTTNTRVVGPDGVLEVVK
jgi:hypothetical protein